MAHQSLIKARIVSAITFPFRAWILAIGECELAIKLVLSQPNKPERYSCAGGLQQSANVRWKKSPPEHGSQQLEFSASREWFQAEKFLSFLDR
jgi:hypothetical protein